jgi:hypothetical protein
MRDSMSFESSVMSGRALVVTTTKSHPSGGESSEAAALAMEEYTA